MEKKCSVVMLPTEKATRLWINGKRKLQISTDEISSSNNIGQYLYFVSDMEIKEGDWVYVSCSELNVFEVRQVTGYYNEQFLFDKKSQIHMDYCKKIEAATDTSLLIEYSNNLKTPYSTGFPKIPESFVEEFIKSYNNGSILSIIKDVFIEMEKYLDNDVIDDGTNYKEFSVTRVKTRHDNTVIIHPIEEIQYHK